MAVLFRRKRLIVGIFLAVLLAAVAGVLLIADEYEASVKFLVKGPRGGQLDEAPGYLGSSVTNAVLNSELAILTSLDNLRKVVDRCDLAQFESGDEPVVREQAALEKLQRALDASKLDESNVFEVRYRSANQQTAAEVLHVLTEIYLQEHVRLHASPEMYEFFKVQAEKFEAELRQAEAELAGYRAEHNVFVIEQQKREALEKLSAMQAALNSTDASIEQLKLELANAENQAVRTERHIVAQARSIPNQYAVERLNTMLVDLRNKRIELAAKFNPGDRAIHEVDEQIQQTTEALEKAQQEQLTERATEPNPVLSALELRISTLATDLSGLRARRDILATQVKDQERRQASLEAVTTKHGALVRQVETSEQNYLLYGKRREQARIADSLDRQGITSVAVLEESVVPQKPVGPNRKLNLALGFILAVLFSIGAAFAVESMQSRVYTPRQLERATGLRVLATIPAAPEGRR